MITLQVCLAVGSPRGFKEGAPRRCPARVLRSLAHMPDWLLRSASDIIYTTSQLGLKAQDQVQLGSSSPGWLTTGLHAVSRPGKMLAEGSIGPRGGWARPGGLQGEVWACLRRPRSSALGRSLRPHAAPLAPEVPRQKHTARIPRACPGTALGSSSWPGAPDRSILTTPPCSSGRVQLALGICPVLQGNGGRGPGHSGLGTGSSGSAAL